MKASWQHLPLVDRVEKKVDGRIESPRPDIFYIILGEQ